MPGVPPIQGMVAYDFREAINALARSMADAAMLASRWYDLCDTRVAKDVTVSLSSGESMTVPNLGKAIEALMKRQGPIDASAVRVHAPNFGVDINAGGIDIAYYRGDTFADGTPREQHHYLFPHNDFFDMSYLTSGTSDSIVFNDVPRFLWFDADSGLTPVGTHMLTIQPLAANVPPINNRTDTKGVCLCTRLTIVNGDPSRTATILVANNVSGNIVLSIILMPGQHADCLVWCWRGADACNIIQIA